MNPASPTRNDGATATPADSVAPITIALTAPVHAGHAPWPRNDGERLLFAQLYEPLLRLDCTGAIVPGLAQSWIRESTPISGASSWRFVLRRDARFHGGERVSAADVVGSWRRSAAAHSVEQGGRLIATIASGAVAMDDSTLLVTLPDSLASARTFASPDLAVVRPANGDSWPDGTTSYHVDSELPVSDTTAASRAFELRSSRASAPLLFRFTPGADARDAIDAGVDLIVTSSPSAVQYARTQEGRAPVPLPWTRSYAVLFTGRATSAPRAACVSDDVRALRDALAAAVHAEARGAEGPFWWNALGDSSLASQPAGAPPCAAAAEVSPSPARKPAPADAAQLGSDTGGPRIVYPRGDSTARELAERIVALAAPGRQESSAAGLRSATPELFEVGGWRAVALDSIRFAQTLARGDERAFLFALPRQPRWPAATRASLLSAAPWLTPFGATTSLLPLVDTRETLLIRRARGIPRMTILHDGTVIFDSSGSDVAGSAP